MARYRKVQPRTWGDRQFRALTPIPPCGQGLWLRLLTGPEMTAIPGVIVARRAGLAEALGWTPEAFAEAFAEVSSGPSPMAFADWSAGLVWLPRALHQTDNKPASPNVVRSWGKLWPEIPECSLKDEVLQALSASAKGWGKAYSKAFGEAFGKASDNPSPNREQEQEQEQEQEGGVGSRSIAQRPASTATPPAPSPRATAARPYQDPDESEPWREVLTEIGHMTPAGAERIRITASAGRHVAQRLAEGYEIQDLLTTFRAYARAIETGLDDPKWWGPGMFKPERLEIAQQKARAVEATAGPAPETIDGIEVQEHEREALSNGGVEGLREYRLRVAERDPWLYPTLQTQQKPTSNTPRPSASSKTPRPAIAGGTS